MSASQFATFAAYTPPPDSVRHPDSSYQSGAVPTFSSVQTTSEPPVNQWESSCGLRIDLLAFGAYLFGPISALALLIFETQNDYVRFHAYQSALLTTPVVFLRVFLSVVQAASWIKTVYSMMAAILTLYSAAIAYRNASNNDLVYYRLPYIGAIAEAWLSQE